MTAFVLFCFFLFLGGLAPELLGSCELTNLIYILVYTVHLRSGVKALESKHKHKERKQGEKKGEGGGEPKQTNEKGAGMTGACCC